MASIDVLFLSKEDMDAIGLTPQEMLDAVETDLRAHGERKVILPSKDHLPLDYPEKLFNILKGYVGPIEACGVKVLINSTSSARIVKY